MLNLKILIRILQPEFTRKILHILLILALIPLLDCFLIIRMAQILGVYLFLAILMAISLSGFFFSGIMINKTLKQIDENLKSNILSVKNYQKLPGTLVISFLLIIPGLVSTLIGCFLSFSYFRTIIGRRVSNCLRIDWKEIHEYLNIID